MQSSFRYFYYGGLRGFLPLLLQQFLLEILPLFSGFSPIVSPGISVFFICFSPRCPRRISSTVLFRIHSEIFAYFHCDFLLRRSCFPGDSPRVFFDVSPGVSREISPEVRSGISSRARAGISPRSPSEFPFRCYLRISSGMPCMIFPETLADSFPRDFSQRFL